jgi:hopanoid biosynthesis associated radical SAM protein HpnH
VAEFFDEMMAIGVDGVTVSPGYAYERAPDQDISSTAPRPSSCSATSSAGQGRGKAWKFTQSTLFMDFLAGNQTYHCTPWGNPTRNVFGWQRPCYLLGEGYAKTFKELMEDHRLGQIRHGNYEKCADCMVHSGYEATAAMLPLGSMPT